MRLNVSSLGLKLNLALLLFLLILGGATAGIILYGFSRTQTNATARSQEALEDLGLRITSSFAESQSSLGQLQMESAAETGQAAAHYLSELRRIGGSVPYDASRLERGAGGQLFDVMDGRGSDVYIPNFAGLNDAVLRDLSDSAALDALFPSVGQFFPGRLRDASFDALAVYFHSVNNVTRSYPPTGAAQIGPPNRDVRPELAIVSPAQNPERKTVWTAPYDNGAGYGQVMTALTPVYDGDEFRGVIGVDLSVGRLVDLINIVKPTPNGFAFYVDKRGALLASRAHATLLPAFEDPKSELSQILESMKLGGTAVERADLGGEEMFVAYTSFGEIGGSLAVAAPVSEITAQAAAITDLIDQEGNRTLLVSLAAMGSLFAVGLAAAGWMNRRVILRPVEALVAGTRAVTAGNLYTAIDVPGKDEMALLARSFNEMTADIRQRRMALELEVRERKQAQDELRALFAAMTDVVLLMDRAGRFLRVPETNAPYVLLPAQELPGRLLSEVMPGQADDFLRVIERALDEQTTITVEYPLARENEPVMWFSAAISPVSSGQVVVVARDITDRVNARQELERQVTERTRELTTVLDVSRDLGSTLDLATLLQLIIQQVRTVADYSGSSIFLLEGDTLVIFDSMAHDGARLADLVGTRTSVATIAPLWQLIGNGRPAIIEDIRGGSDAARALRRASGPLLETALRDIRSWMGVPLLVKERVIGMLTIAHTQPAYYTEHHAQVVAAIANQASIAIENARLYEQAQQLAAVEERQRLARELHDSVSQALYGIALGARTARTLLDRDPARAVEPVDYVLSLAEAGLAEMRALIFELRPESLEIEGLVAALDKQIAATSARYNIAVEAQLGEEPALPLGIKEVFYRVGQEALHNVVKHAHATRAVVRLSNGGNGVSLEVSDDGIGFDTGERFPGHIGLVSMTERAASIGAALQIESAKGRGTTVRIVKHVAVPEAVADEAPAQA